MLQQLRNQTLDTSALDARIWSKGQISGCVAHGIDCKYPGHTGLPSPLHARDAEPNPGYVGMYMVPDKRHVSLDER